MKRYFVIVTETLEKAVEVSAETPEDAEELVMKLWNNSEIILDSSNFREVTIKTIRG